MRVEGADAYHTLGAVGMCVNGIFLLICSWRLANAARVSEYHWMESRVVLHITVFIFALLEFMYQISIFATEKYGIISPPRSILHEYLILLFVFYMLEYLLGVIHSTFLLLLLILSLSAWSVVATPFSACT